METDIAAQCLDDYVIIRATNAGCFAGILKQVQGRTVLLGEAIRLWYWSGADSLSEMANLGVSQPEECKFPAPVEKEIIYEVIEIIPMTEKAIMSVLAVPAWSAHPRDEGVVEVGEEGEVEVLQD